jgi:acyl carrier protein
VNELRAHLRERLPEYMVPWSFEYLDRLPLNANGKVDREALPEPLSSPEVTGDYVPPRTATEEIMADIWSQVLGVPRVGIQDDFFEAGGHSLKATQIISRIANDFKVQIRVRELFSSPTIAELVEIIRNAESTEESALVRVPETPHYDLSYGQKLIWISSQFGNQSVYNIPAAYMFEGEFNVQLFESAFNGVSERHQILTTTIDVIDDEPQQRLNPQIDLKLQLLDLSAHENPEAKAIEVANSEAIAPFNLENGPLFRALLLKLSATRHVFVMTMHHIISDGWSLSIFVSELLSRYGAPRTGTEFPLPPLNIQYQDFVAWQSRRLSTEALHDDRDYWLTTLNGKLPTLELPTDYPRPKVRTFNGAVVELTIDKDLTAELYLLSRNYSATLFMTLLAGLDALFYRYTGHTDIILASPISGRTNKDLENQIGLFINMLPLRVRVHGEHTFAQLLDQVREVTLSAYEHQAYPFALLVKELNLERDPARPLLVNTALTLQNQSTPAHFDSNELGFTITQFQQEVKTSEYDLCFLFSEKDDALTAYVNYNTDIFHHETIELMWSRLVSVFVQVTGDPERKMMDLEMSEDEAPDQLQDLAIELNV